jgi:hypothetical protein
LPCAGGQRQAVLPQLVVGGCARVIVERHAVDVNPT